MRFKVIACAVFVAGALTSAAGGGNPSFSVAVPVWPQGRERCMNDFVEFRTFFDSSEGARPVLRITGASVYRIRLNGVFAGYGPARAAPGFFRVDEWALAAKPGRNELSIEVSAYNCNTFYIPEHPAFLQAEVDCDGCILAATGRGSDFSAFETTRITKCSRYSYQRAFGEAYRPSPNGEGEKLTLVAQPAVRLVERIAAYPKFEFLGEFGPSSRTRVRIDSSGEYPPARFVDSVQSWFKCYAHTNLDVNIYDTLRHTRTTLDDIKAAGGRITAGEGVQYDVGRNASGFIVLDVECLKAGTLWVAFDEVLQCGVVAPMRSPEVANAVCFEMTPGRRRIETFEPYTMRHVHAYTFDGEFSLGKAGVREYRSPAADAAALRTSDGSLDAIFAAARETFAQNAVDVFTDCPGRERAGWLCDSFFLARASALLTGSTDLERLFFQNYMLPEKYADIPEGMIPMCFPADIRNGNYIPNWAMWFAIQLGEYLARSGDRATVDALKPRMLALVDFFRRFRNSDGLLENLGGWTFIEWSEANKLVKDVNYPTNATWAEMLDAVAGMYAKPELAEEAERVRETIRRQSWTGRWFCDNAVRESDGTIKPSGKCTETCQYYMFAFGVATRETHPALWNTLVSDFGPRRRETNAYPEVFPANAFIGNFLRLELLSRAGLSRQVVDESRGYFAHMAEQTGTLWEHEGTRASCNHGFASYVAVLYARNVAGIVEIDGSAKTVAVRNTDVPLDFCEMALPVDGGTVTYGWRREGAERVETFRAPLCWRTITAQGDDCKKR